MIESETRTAAEPTRKKNRAVTERRAIPRNEPVRFGQSFASSEGFKALFAEGIALVEEAAAYLDGPGREEAKALTRMPALAYANESMRLTTRLMQLASWLLIQRAVIEGEMTQSQATQQFAKVKLGEKDRGFDAGSLEGLPLQLQDLSARSLRLQQRVMHIDTLLNTRPARAAEPVAPLTNGVAAQWSMLSDAFGVR
jgi:regulator of CtrA degradation